MRLGKDTGSVVNHLLCGAHDTSSIVAGMGATVCYWTDREPATVVSFDGKILVVREDDAIRKDANGMSDCQTYEYAPNPNGRTHTFMRNRKGEWVSCERNERNRWVKCGSAGLCLGTRSKYYDYSF